LSDGNETREKKLDIPADFSFDDAVLDKLKLAGYKPGDKTDYSIFIDADMKIVPATKEVMEKDGDLIPVVTTIKASMPFKIKEYFTPEGSPEKAEYVDMGMVFIPTTKEKAESGYPGLVLASSTVKADKWLKDPQLIRRLRLKVVSDKADLQTLFVSDELQKIEKKGQDTILATESMNAVEFYKLSLPLDEPLKKQLAPYLAPTEMIQSNDPVVLEKASDLEGVETDVWKLSVWISQKVRKLLVPSSDLAFASAVEALEKGRGDCTEYAVVFAALARALGIPVKVCYGIVGTGTDEFLFHAWNEVYAGRWIPIDAALDQDQVDATHLALYKGPGNDQLDAGAKIMKAMARLRFEVLEVKYATGEQEK
jgi:transglutaminase-like putative cysteine protease